MKPQLSFTQNNGQCLNMRSNIFLLIIIYLILIPISNFSQISYWVALILSPFLFFTNIVKSINFNQNRYLTYLFLTFLLVLFTGVISFNIIWPIKKSLAIFSIWLTSFFLIRKLEKMNDVISALQGIVVSSLLYSLIMFYDTSLINYTFSFRESTLLGKNSTAPMVMIGMFSSMLLYNLLGRKKKYYIVTIYFLVIIIMTTAIKIIIPSIIVLFFFILLSYSKYSSKIKFSFISFLILSVFAYFVYSRTDIREAYEYNVMTSRITALFGGIPEIDYTVNVTVKRESLIQDGWNIFLDNKLFGIGLENTRDILGTYTHNTFIELLAGGGFFTALFFLFVLVYCFKEIITVKQNNIRTLLILMFFSIITIGQAQRLYDNQAIMLFITILIIIPIKLKKI